MTLLDDQVADEPEIAEDAAEATPEFEAAAIKAESRRGFLMALPAYAYLVLFFAVPLAIVFIYSFATRNRFGGTDLSGWNLDAYNKLGEPIVRNIMFRSLWLAILTTVICLLIGYPFAYYLATRRPVVRNLMLVFVMIPFWANFLVRNYAWRVLLGRDGLVSNTFEFVGLGSREYLFTSTAVMIGLVYGFLPFMILPLYASIERIDDALLEASRDLYANGFPLLGSYIVTQFLTARNWPVGASLSFVLMAVMGAAMIVYFRNQGRNL
jgi:spermidine/putrescine transport system permease protein